LISLIKLNKQFNLISQFNIIQSHNRQNSEDSVVSIVSNSSHLH